MATIDQEDLLLDQLSGLYLHYHRHATSGCCSCDRFLLVQKFLMRPWEEDCAEVKHNAAAG